MVRFGPSWLGTDLSCYTLQRAMPSRDLQVLNSVHRLLLSVVPPATDSTERGDATVAAATIATTHTVQRARARAADTALHRSDQRFPDPDPIPLGTGHWTLLVYLHSSIHPWTDQMRTIIEEPEFRETARQNSAPAGNQFSPAARATVNRSGRTCAHLARRRHRTTVDSIHPSPPALHLPNHLLPSRI
jgi:hypothetical protein